MSTAADTPKDTPQDAHQVAATSHIVTLPSGQRVAVQTTAAGRQLATALPGQSSGGGYLTKQIAGDQYVIPFSAVAQLGKQWNQGQFDVSALVRGDAPRQAVRPNFPMHTVTFTVIGADGKPAPSADVTLVNTDDSRKYAGDAPVNDGVAKASVPDGNYTASVLSFNDDGSVQFLVSDFTVQGESAATLDLRKANVPISVKSPKPATLTGLDVDWFRGSSDQYGYGIGLGADPSAPLYVSPTPVVTTGVEHFSVHGRLESPSSAASPYTYDLDFPTDGQVPANNTYRATSDQLATQTATYYSESGARAGGDTHFALFPWEFAQFRSIYHMNQPGKITQYFTGRSDILASDITLADYNFGGFMSSGTRVYQAGSRTSTNWYHGPIAPGITGYTGFGPFQCTACRSGDTLSIGLSPMNDAVPDHSGFLDDPSLPGVESSAHFQLFAGDKQIVDSTDVVGGDFPVPAATSDYKLVYDQVRKAPWFGQSDTSHTEWTFSSGHVGAGSLPANWFCGLTVQLDNCAPVSLLTVHYKLPVTQNGQLPAGPASATVTIGHTPGAPETSVTAGTIAVSFDGGTSWTPVRVTDLGRGQYRATWTNPASAKATDVAIKMSAKDAAGETVTQQIDKAYTISPASSAAVAKGAK